MNNNNNDGVKIEEKSESHLTHGANLLCFSCEFVPLKWCVASPRRLPTNEMHAIEICLCAAAAACYFGAQEMRDWKLQKKARLKRIGRDSFFFLNCFFFAFLLFLFHSASFFMFCKKNVSFCELRVFFLCITHGARMCAQMELRRFSSFAHRFCVLYYYCEWTTEWEKADGFSKIELIIEKQQHSRDKAEKWKYAAHFFRSSLNSK